MTTANQCAGPAAAIDWKDGSIPVSRRFDDPYFSLSGGLEESRHVFLGGNDLPARFRPGFHIAELGFGTGLNMIVALIAWCKAGLDGPLHYTSFEAYPMDAPDMRRALGAFPEARVVADPLLDQWQAGQRLLSIDGLEARIVIGDARDTLTAWEGTADAWFLDGFSPAKNPELWTDTLMSEVAGHTAPGGSFATYTAAGFVRRSLAAAGFSVTRRPGFAGKRHMTLGMLTA
jgi:tRNA U34 5-methylaminomethyl-2-thiouridine-forming methyltransferase MnmC